MLLNQIEFLRPVRSWIKGYADERRLVEHGYDVKRRRFESTERLPELGRQKNPKCGRPQLTAFRLERIFQFITGHMVYNPAYNQILQTKETITYSLFILT